MTAKILQTCTLALFLVAPIHADQLDVKTQPVPRGFKFYATHFAADICAGTAASVSAAMIHGDESDLELLNQVLIFAILKCNIHQGVDTYVLKNGIERTTKQKIMNAFFGFLADPFMDLKTKAQREAEAATQAPIKEAQEKSRIIRMKRSR